MIHPLSSHGQVVSCECGGGGHVSVNSPMLGARTFCGCGHGCGLGLSWSGRESCECGGVGHRYHKLNVKVEALGATALIATGAGPHAAHGAG